MKLNHDLVFNENDLGLMIGGGSAALLPTDTLPALASLPKYADNLWKIKNRSTSKPLILMGSCYEDLFKYVQKCAADDALRMANLYWPGSLTLVVPSTGSILASLNKKSQTLGIRVPACEITRRLLSRTGPLATTSANQAGYISSMNEHEASKSFPKLPLLGPLPWPKASGLGSSIISWEYNGCWKVLRFGELFNESNTKNRLIHS